MPKSIHDLPALSLTHIWLHLFSQLQRTNGPSLKGKGLDWVSGAIDVASTSEGVHYLLLFRQAMKPYLNGKKKPFKRY